MTGSALRNFLHTSLNSLRSITSGLQANVQCGGLTTVNLQAAGLDRYELEIPFATPAAIPSSRWPLTLTIYNQTVVQPLSGSTAAVSSYVSFYTDGGGDGTTTSASLLKVVGFVGFIISTIGGVLWIKHGRRLWLKHAKVCAGGRPS